MAPACLLMHSYQTNSHETQLETERYRCKTMESDARTREDREESQTRVMKDVLHLNPEVTCPLRNMCT